MDPAELILRGRYVRLEPLGRQHVEALSAASAADPSLFDDSIYKWTIVPQGIDEAAAYVQTALDWCDAGYMNSTFANLSGHQKMEAAHRAVLEMHCDDAAARDITDGDPVEVFNARGSIELTARITHRIPPGVVASRLSWNKLSPGGHNVNLLTSQRLTDLGGGATFYSTLVEVRKPR